MRAELSTLRLTPASYPWAWLQLARQRVPMLWYFGWGALALTLPLMVLGIMDGRTFGGANVWAKPWKFHLSVGVHLLTLALVAASLPPTPERQAPLRRLSAVAIGWAVFELVYITGRAALGEASHFNVSTLFAGVMYSLMGIGAVSLTACAGLLGIWVARARDFPWGEVVQRGLALGLIMGCVLGTLTGAYVSAQSGHLVGVPSADDARLAVIGWSREVGDLRAAHFFGLHAMHAIPLVALVLATWRRTSAALMVLNGVAVAYAILTVFVFWQAVSGQPLF